MTKNELIYFISRKIEDSRQKAHGPHAPLPSVADAILKILLYSRFRKGALGEKDENRLRMIFRPR
ncbi:MAG TPA: hypothetical protein VMC43_03170, partial [Candidatus Paceibacterota bacterium]|nr:hypothetical protein [Candidatus Paceibacterota bacterium]